MNRRGAEAQRARVDSATVEQMSNITKEQFEEAIRAKEEADKLINAYLKQEQAKFDERLLAGTPFTDDELIYAATSLCPCGHGVAYPKGCNPHHYWDCSAILKGIADPGVQHIGKLPFALYEIKSEGQPSANGATTRGVFRPKPAA